jgi:hypothetical protein
MDLDARGRPDLDNFLTEAYQRRTGDGDFFMLLPFYRCYRAYVRGKVLSFRLNEAEFSEEERCAAAAQARNYFDLAIRYASRLKEPTIIAVGGLSGTGKTSYCARHRRRTQVESDLRRRRASLPLRRSQKTGSLRRPHGRRGDPDRADGWRRHHQSSRARACRSSHYGRGWIVVGGHVGHCGYVAVSRFIATGRDRSLGSRLGLYQGFSSAPRRQERGVGSEIDSE